VSRVIDEHRQYLADRFRLTHYDRALREVVRRGDLVVDLASGTGILGLLACRAGARRVIAIEAEPIAGLARTIARTNGCGDRIEVIRSVASHAPLPERADLIVSDQIGRFGFEAGLLSLFADARARMLKPGGRLMPSALALMVAPVEHPRQFAHVAFWGARRAGFDFTPVRSIAANTGYPTRLSRAQLLADPAVGCRVDLSVAAPVPLRVDAGFAIGRKGILDGIGGWFEAQLSPSVTLSNSPLDRHRITRRQAYFPVDSPVAVAKGDEVTISMRILPEDSIVSWTVTVTPRSGDPIQSSHSTLAGMLVEQRDVHRTDPSYRPALTARGVARRTVLELCDGSRTLAELEAEVCARHPNLFTTAEDAAIFVGEVVTRYTHDAN
jgi:protein arginine N-methyltransferase 1